MVDFNKELPKKSVTKITDPRKIYEGLDRASDKGPLREVQDKLLKNWHQNFRSRRDVILKLHTGQGKTLIGLLILQSKLQETESPALYLCPNKFLIDQTCAQAKSFGIRYCTTGGDGEIPQAFLDGEAILITTVQKLFNGRTKFKTGAAAIPVGSIVLDDCHASIEAIRKASSILLPSLHPAYSELRDLFAESLRAQGAGTFQDLLAGNADAVLPISYWEWFERQDEVLTILSKHNQSREIFFSWPILKDHLKSCQCAISGGALEIAPPVLPLDFFGSFVRAAHRVFMSATVTDDSYLIRGLQLEESAVKEPLNDPDERWSGEKMILFPTLMDVNLDRHSIVEKYGPPNSKRKSGVVVLTPSFSRAEDWKSYGARVATSETLNSVVQALQSGDYSSTVVIANRYDGIDLPDDTCRRLILDSNPYSENPIDAYMENCRPNSKLMLMRKIRRVEQGLGRSVRGEKDYCAFLVIGDDLSRLLRSVGTRELLSTQTRTQIELGIKIAELAKRDIAGGDSPMDVLTSLVRQCLDRDSGWKNYYTKEMNKIPPVAIKNSSVDLHKLELLAETRFLEGQYDQACKHIQRIIDEKLCDTADVGWYLQEMGRYKYLVSKTDSNAVQISAHRKNKLLMRPRSGMEFEALEVVSKARMKLIIDWIKQFKDFGDLSLRVSDIASRLHFGVKADNFEAAVDEMGAAIGFPSERPDKKWKEGPDNLWGVKDGEYFVIECKNGVSTDRKEINKAESGQMNTACAWFKKNYASSTAHHILISPTRKLSHAAAFTHEVLVIRERSLKTLVNNFNAFFAEFRESDFSSLTEKDVQKYINQHQLTPGDILKHLTEPATS